MASPSYDHLSLGFNTLNIYNLPPEKYSLPMTIDNQLINGSYVQAFISKILIEERMPKHITSISEKKNISFGNYHCQTCQSRLVMPPSGQYMCQTCRGDEPATFFLHCLVCKQNQII